MLICPTIVYLNSLDDLLPEIDTTLTAKILDDPESFVVKRNVLTEDKCFICCRAASYLFYQWGTDNKTSPTRAWCCGYCAVHLAHKMYTIIEDDAAEHITTSLLKLKTQDPQPFFIRK